MQGKQNIGESSNSHTPIDWAHFADNTSFHSWIVDSGAIDHMAFDAKKFSNKRKLDKMIEVGLPDGSCTHGWEIVDVVICANITLYNVLLVPTFKLNLLYVGQLVVHHSKIEVKFSLF